MEYYIIQIVCLAILLIGCGKHSYKLGLKDGANKTVDMLREAKIICHDDQGNIKPNPFFDS